LQCDEPGKLRRSHASDVGKGVAPGRDCEKHDDAGIGDHLDAWLDVAVPSSPAQRASASQPWVPPPAIIQSRRALA